MKAHLLLKLLQLQRERHHHLWKLDQHRQLDQSQKMKSGLFYCRRHLWPLRILSPNLKPDWNPKRYVFQFIIKIFIRNCFILKILSGQSWFSYASNTDCPMLRHSFRSRTILKTIHFLLLVGGWIVKKKPSFILVNGDSKSKKLLSLPHSILVGF